MSPTKCPIYLALTEICSNPANENRKPPPKKEAVFANEIILIIPHPRQVVRPPVSYI